MKIFFTAEKMRTRECAEILPLSALSLVTPVPFLAAGRSAVGIAKG
jgi:hypothetical protein